MTWRGCLLRNPLFQVVALLVATFIFNEFLVYYTVLLQCNWPSLKSQNGSSQLRAMFLADTHLLGPTGHWWDRLRREWQMERAFQTAMTLHQPEMVFILGDLFDDGKWSSNAAFNKDVKRFHKMFRHPPTTKLVSVIGNHDVGFHYMITNDKLDRFVRAVNSSDSIQLIEEKDILFVTANSMAFEGDDCSMCQKAQKELQKVSEKLQCAEDGDWSGRCKKYEDQKFSYSSPIILQHYPMFRESDEICTGVDSAPESEKHDLFRPRFDCLSEQASQQLMSAVKPRLIISGHTHHFCLRKHTNGVYEWSVPSFSWRNKKGSSFLLASFNPEKYAVNKCYMPDENTVVTLYMLASAVGGINIVARLWMAAVKRHYARNDLKRH